MIDRLTYFEDGKWRMDLPNGSQWCGNKVDRIAELENEAERRIAEQGRGLSKTVGVPCDIGDTVYALHRGNIEEWTVTGIHLLRDGHISLNASRFLYDDYEIYTNFDYQLGLNYHFFLNREDAENAKLSLDAQIHSASSRVSDVSAKLKQQEEELDTDLPF